MFRFEVKDRLLNRLGGGANGEWQVEYQHDANVDQHIVTLNILKIVIIQITISISSCWWGKIFDEFTRTVPRSCCNDITESRFLVIFIFNNLLRCFSNSAKMMIYIV